MAGKHPRRIAPLPSHEVEDLPDVERLLDAAEEGESVDLVLVGELEKIAEDCGTPYLDLRRTFDALWAKNPAASKEGILRLLRSIV